MFAEQLAELGRRQRVIGDSAGMISSSEPRLRERPRSKAVAREDRFALDAESLYAQEHRINGYSDVQAVTAWWHASRCSRAGSRCCIFQLAVAPWRPPRSRRAGRLRPLRRNRLGFERRNVRIRCEAELELARADARGRPSAR